VRAASPEEAERRLPPPPPGRLRAVAGDLARPGLGLPPDVWRELADRVDTVWHVAARVNLVLGYEALRPDNFLGTAEVLRLAAGGRAKKLHYVSTLSVFVGTDLDRGTLREDQPLGSARWAFGGYAQSKWAAEWLVSRAAGRVGPVAVYRPGLVTGDSVTGRGSAGDFLTLFVRGLTRLGCLPPVDAASLLFDVTPVDYCARALVRLSLREEGRDRVAYHVAGAGRWSLADVVAALARRGVAVAPVDADAWRERLAALGRESPDAAAACLALCRALPGPDRFARYRPLDLFPAGEAVFDMRHTAAGLAGSGIVCPPPTPALLDRYLDHALALP
jgi:thioester reductase-like protein